MRSSTKLLLTMCTLVLLFLGLSVATGQDDPAPTANQPAFIYRDAEGTERTMTSVVSSQQMADMIAEIKKANDKLDYLVSQQAQEEFEPEQVAVEINSASYDDLLSIPGIGKVKAGALIMARDTPEYSPFLSWDDLATRVNGIGPGTVADMKAAGITLVVPSTDDTSP